MATALTEGMMVDGFRVGARVHSGSMAALYEVTRDDIDAPLIMKVPVENSNDPLTIVGFEMEQMILPQLKGPHVPKVYAIGQFEAQPYIVMEQIDGSSLLGSLYKRRCPSTKSCRSASRLPKRLTTFTASTSFISISSRRM